MFSRGKFLSATFGAAALTGPHDAARHREDARCERPLQRPLHLWDDRTMGIRSLAAERQGQLQLDFQEGIAATCRSEEAPARRVPLLLSCQVRDQLTYGVPIPRSQ